MTAILIPELDNTHDRSAVAVYLDGALAGHLPREVAARAHAALLALAAARGGPAWCPAHVIFYDGGPQVVLSLDAAALGLGQNAFDAVPALALAIQKQLTRLAARAPFLTGTDRRARAALASAERLRAEIDANYNRVPSDWRVAEEAFRLAAAALGRARDPLISEAWLGVARSVRHQPGRRDEFVSVIVDALYWNRLNVAAWAELVDYASSAPHVPTLAGIYDRVPPPARPWVLRQLLSMSRGTDRLGRMTPEAGKQLRAKLVAHAGTAGTGRPWQS